MNILLNIEELFPYMSNGNIRLPLEMVIIFCIIVLVILAVIISVVMGKEREIKKMDLVINSKNSKIESLKRYATQEKKSSASQIEKLKKELSDTQLKLVSRDDQMNKQNLHLSEKSDEISSLQHDVDSLTSEVDELNNVIIEKEAALSVANEKLESMEQEINRVKSENDSLQKSLSDQQDKLKYKTQELKTAKEQLISEGEKVSVTGANKKANPFERLANW